MKKLGGLPLSAFVAYSRKRKNSENTTNTKTTKKKRVRVVTALKHQRTQSNVTAKVGIKAKLNKKNNKRRKKKLTNGNTAVPQAETNEMECNTTEKEQLDNSLKAKEPEVADEEINSSPETPEAAANLPNAVWPPTKIKEKPPKKNTLTPTEGKNGNNEKSETQQKTKIPKGLNNNPIEEGKSLFQWLIHPVTVENFFKENWERAPLQIKRSGSNYYKLLMSTPMMDSILRNFHILFTKNIDITSYTDGQRETHNPPGRALPSVVWDYYSNGCSIRMLNPQTFIPKLHALNATLQEFFGCFVGANSYLTPPDSQGFAPHYDDIEAFILQIEGKKRWRLYKPTTEREYLPRYSSRNFDPSEIGEPILDTVINAGDLLYFPRGTIHQGETIDGTHSLHVTLSVYQKNSWCDFLEKLIPDALKTAVDADCQFREGLPIDYLRHVGSVHSAKETETRTSFAEKTKDLLHRLIDHIDVDKIADQMAKDNIHDFLPPVLSPEEQNCSVLKDGEKMIAEGLITNRIEIEPDTRIRLLRSHCIRLVEEEDCMRIYYSTENSKEYHEYEAQFLEVGKELAPAIQEIIQRYPDFVRVEDLPIEGEDNKVQVARDLWEKCIVVTDVRLPVIC